ncbi:WD40 repeat domain-containing protein [Actinacidiphila soli]|uniref:hypothetical protein n=1 Tax=Actinacidiphila soli TaxID=2487275 RepID=UPI000FCA9ED8|nr:hypothetical protein [Actinacidiphila soli]
MAGRVGFGVLAHFAPGGEEGLSPDERSLLAGCSRDVLRREHPSDPERTQNRIRMWDTASGDCVRVFDPQPTGASELRLSGDGRFAVSCGVESAVRVWEVATGRCLGTLDGQRRNTAGLAITTDVNFALTADGDQTLRLWELDWDLQPPSQSF